MSHFEATAVIHSLSANRGPNHPNPANMDTVTKVEHTDNNSVIAEYKGKRYRAIFNPFHCIYYVDDKYGLIAE
ncbi:MAG: hypothetical protein LBC63_01145 [Holophagales bacterium]|jgi:hypothetical protein|nr:hypothetical protein [Holophagales bacterium]